MAIQVKKCFTDSEFSEGPKGADWRTTTDAVMIPDPSFIRQLRALDPELFVQWDWGAQKWEIWRKPKGKPSFHMMTVQNQDRTYRELGADILLKLQAGDPQRYTLKQMVDYFNAMDDAILASKKRAIDNFVESAVKEHLWYIAGYRAQVPRCYEKAAVKIEGPKNEIPILPKNTTQMLTRVVNDG